MKYLVLKQLTVVMLLAQTDMLQWLMGSRVRRISGVIRRYQHKVEAEDFAAGYLEFDDGAVALVEASINTYPENLEERLSIFGQKGTIVFAGQHMNILDTWNEPDRTKVDILAAVPKTDKPEGHSALYREFAAALKTGGEVSADLQEGVKSVEIVLGLYKSMKTGAPVDLPCAFSTAEMEGVWNL